MRDWSRDALVASGVEETARGAPSPCIGLSLRFAQHDTTVGLAVWMNRRPIHPKNLTKTLLSVCDPTRAVQLATKGGDIDLKLIKAIMIVAILATALSFGACAQKKETVTTSAGTTGYHK